MDNYSVFNILDLLETLGEDEVCSILSEFSCPKNTEIEDFLHSNAIEFAKRKMSISYLVFNDTQEFVGYFTLTHKMSSIPCDTLSKTSCKKLSMHSKLNENTLNYDVSAFLIAQFSKNYAVQDGNAITGDCLMDYVFDILFRIQHLVGGGVVFLECEEKQKLLDFYQNQNNRFKPYGERYSVKDNKKYIQLLRLF